MFESLAVRTPSDPLQGWETTGTKWSDAWPLLRIRCRRKSNERLAFRFLVAFGGFNHLVMGGLLNPAVGEKLVQKRFILGRNPWSFPAAFAWKGTPLARVIQRPVRVRARQFRLGLFPIGVSQLIGVAFREASDFARPLFNHRGRSHPEFSFATGKVADRHLRVLVHILMVSAFPALREFQIAVKEDA